MEVDLSALKRRIRTLKQERRYSGRLSNGNLNLRLMVDVVLALDGTLPSPLIKNPKTIVMLSEYVLPVSAIELPSELIIHEILPHLPFRDLFSYLSVNRSTLLLQTTTGLIPSLVATLTRNQLHDLLVKAALARNHALLRSIMDMSYRKIDRSTYSLLRALYTVHEDRVGQDLIPTIRDRFHYRLCFHLTHGRGPILLTAVRSAAVWAKRLREDARNQASYRPYEHTRLFIQDLATRSPVTNQRLRSSVAAYLVRYYFDPIDIRTLFSTPLYNKELTRDEEDRRLIIDNCLVQIAELAANENNIELLEILTELPILQVILPKILLSHSSASTIQRLNMHYLLDPPHITSTYEFMDVKLWKRSWSHLKTMDEKEFFLTLCYTALSPVEALQYAKTLGDESFGVLQNLMLMADKHGYTGFTDELTSLLNKEGILQQVYDARTL